MIDYNQILPNLYVGTYPRKTEDIQELKDCCGVTAVLNLQTDEDLRERAIDWPAMQAIYRKLSIEVRHREVREWKASCFLPSG